MRRTLGNAGEVYAISQHDPTFPERAPRATTISTCVKHSTDTGLRARSDRSKRCLSTYLVLLSYGCLHSTLLVEELKLG